jgi:plasmid maintenance system antidote protein VapI
MLVADLHESIRLYALATIKSRAITGTKLAATVGVQQAHISNFLTCKRGMSIEKLDALLGALGLNVEQLVTHQTQVHKESSSSIESVPLIHPQAAVNPTFASDEVLGRVGFAAALLRRLKAEPPETRKLWVRFIAIKADKALSAPMNPRVENGSILLIDRHYCSLVSHGKGNVNLYLVCDGNVLMVRRVEVQGAQLCLRPENASFPLVLISINGRMPLTSCIVGRVAHIASET